MSTLPQRINKRRYKYVKVVHIKRSEPNVYNPSVWYDYEFWVIYPTTPNQMQIMTVYNLATLNLAIATYNWTIVETIVEDTRNK